MRTLTAIDTRTNEQIVICDDFERAREAHRADALACPLCGLPVVTVREYFRDGDWVASHVRHKSQEPCTTTYRHHEQTPEHFAAKYHIGKTAAEEFGYEVAECKYEVYFKEVNRQADVCITLVDGSRVIHEAQLSPISVDELEERTNDYQRLGYGIHWHFGKHADTELNKRWAFQRLGACSILDFAVSIEAGA